MKYYIIAGEPSGDLHGSNLMKGIVKADPEAEFRFWGGDMMAEVGGKENLVKHYRAMSFFGFVQVAMNIRTILSQMKDCCRDIKAYAPDVVILIDYPGFNIKVAEFAHNNGIPVHYYIAPKVWAWKEHRVKALKKFVDKLYIIFPFEKEYFRAKGIEPHFEGNPLMDAITERCAAAPDENQFRAENGLDERPIVALLAGSRVSEIKANLRFMAQLAERMPAKQFVVAGVGWIAKEQYEVFTKDMPVKYVCDKTYELLQISEAAVVTSGTATLETALIGIPELVVYGIPWLYEKCKPYLLKIPYVSLVNLNLQREAVREMVVYHPSVDEAEKELRSILIGGSKREKMLSDFDELREIIGGAGASDRFAADIVQTLKAV
ncbi:MAG: lipid-A-disaccharide synthase [Alistipes sp.]|nr:lipid-A-disaccharide synthase [Alistipes sp.]